jgi:hypothetical protein
MTKTNKALSQLFMIGALALTGCGGSDSPPPAPPPSGIDGNWSVTENGTSNCPGEATYTQTYQVAIAVQGAGVTVSTPVGTFTGTFSGHNLHWSGSYREQGGTTTINSLNATVANDNRHFSGSSSWFWTDGRTSCSGNTHLFTGTKM